MAARSLVGVASGAQMIADRYAALQRDALRVVGNRSEAELATIAAFLRDMHAVGVEHVARLQG